MAARKPPIWMIVLAGVLIGGLTGAGIMYASYQNRLAETRSELAATEAELEESRRIADQSAEEPLDLSEQPKEPASQDDSEAEPSEAPAADEDGTQEQFAFVKKLVAGKPGTVELDYAEFLTGASAAKAAAARGEESPPPNDYFIVNDNKKLRTFKIAANAKVRLVSSADGTSDPAGYDSTVERWANHFAAPTDENWSIRNAGYWFVIEDGVVVEVREQYTP
jgi:hypothetical protein